MNFVFSGFFESWSIIKKDKWIIFFSMIPIIVGSLIYYYLGSWLYGDVFTWGKSLIADNVNSDSWINILSYFIIGVLTVLLYFIISWTFVMVVSLISSPFNDIISERVERHLKGEQQKDVGSSLKRVFSNIVHILITEIKKIAFIIVLTLLSILFSFIIPPVSIVISALLLAVSFLDYTWCRKSYSFGKCFGDIKSSILSYTISGGLFLVLIAIPGLNLLALPYAIVYFTFLHIKLNESEDSHDKTPSSAT